MRKPALEVGPHLDAVAHEVARSQQQVDEIERGGARLQFLIAVDGVQQRLLHERREVSIGLAGKNLQRRPQLLVSREDLVARHVAAVITRVSLAWTLERALSQQIDQRGLEPIVVARRDALTREDVLAQLPHRPKVGVERVAGPRARGQLRVQAVHARDERLDRRLAVKRAPLPRRAEIAPADELPARLPQPLNRVAIERAPA